MTIPASRRGFLRGLTTLPLIGGGVALIGAPSAVAAPVTPDLLAAYDTWLFYERRFLRYERFNTSTGADLGCDDRFLLTDRLTGQRCDQVSLLGPAGSFHDIHTNPSTRAALVLSAVGCDWREGGR
ncbi:MAG: hypothetical protein PGN25_05580 [Methylorubrum populi]